jgi:hypothetical protein
MRLLRHLAIYVVLILVSTECDVQATSDFQEHYNLRLGRETNSSNEGMAVLTDAVGNVFVVGHSSPLKDAFPATIAAASPQESETKEWERSGYGGQDVFIAKIFAGGDLAYIRTIGSPFDDFVTAAALDAAGSSLYVTGHSGGNVTDGPISDAGAAVRCATDYFLGRFDAGTGEKVWLLSNGSAATDTSWAIALSADKRHVYTGGSVGGAFIKPVTSGLSQALVVKHSAATGEAVWVTQHEMVASSSTAHAIHVVSAEGANSNDIVRVGVTVDNVRKLALAPSNRRDLAILVVDGRDGQVLAQHVDKLFADTSVVGLTSDTTTGLGTVFAASQVYSDDVHSFEFSCARFNLNGSAEPSKAWETETGSYKPSDRILGFPDLAAGAVMSPSGLEVIVFGSTVGNMTSALPLPDTPATGGATTVLLKLSVKNGSLTHVAQSPALPASSWARAQNAVVAPRGSATARAWAPGDARDVLLITGSAHDDEGDTGTEVLLLVAGVPPASPSVVQESFSQDIGTEEQDKASGDGGDGGGSHAGMSPVARLIAGPVLGVTCTVAVVVCLGIALRRGIAVALAQRAASIHCKCSSIQGSAEQKCGCEENGALGGMVLTTATSPSALV